VNREIIQHSTHCLHYFGLTSLANSCTMAPLSIDATTLEPEIDSSLRKLSPQSDRTIKRPHRKAVSFSDFSELHYVPPVDELTNEEYQATYMTEIDYERIQRESADTLKIMRKGKYPGTTKLYFRGLEIALPQARLERKQRIEHVTSMILREQLLERALHPQWIHNFYSRLTAPAVQAAHAMGLWDAQAVRAEELDETVSTKIQEGWI
jgi:hypothetical protein